jgi:hypothetical protein
MGTPYDLASDKVQAMFVEIATKAGWPQEIIQRVKVRIGQGSLDFEHDPEIEELVKDLEYGNKAEPPKAVFRKLKARVGSQVSGASVSDLIEKYFAKKGLI